ncbi:MAG: T9SS type A sorting domain-containing protein, partial [Bacteroidales bacterium]
AIGTKTFMIGKGGNYRPLALNYSSLDNPSTVTAEQTESTLPGSLPENTTATLARYWTISQTGGTTYNYKITLDGTGFSASGTAVMLKGDGASNSAYAVTTPNYTNTTGFTSFSNFGLGDMTAPTAYNVTGTGSFCQGSGGLAVGLDNSQTGVTYELWKDNIATGETMPGTGASLNFGNKTEGTYTIKGTNAAGTITMNSSAVVTLILTGQWTGAALDNDWATAGNWCGGIPGGSTNVIIPSGSTVHVTSSPGSWAECNNLTIGSTGILIIDAGKALTVNGTITNNNGVSGLVIESDATGTGSLKQNNTGVNATMKRFMNNADWTSWKDGWHFMSSPVASQAISPAFILDPDTKYDFYCWDEPSNLWVNFKNQSSGTGTAPYFDNLNGGNNFNAGKGYMAAYDDADTKSFSGTLNVADVSLSGLTITGSQANRSWHLLGNPFSCALTWDNTWTTSNIAGVAEIWNEDIQDYSALTSFPASVIPATNGFMVQVSGGIGSLTIPESKRVHSAQAFYKSSIPAMKLTARNNVAGNAKESSVCFNPDATAGFDLQYDGEFLHGFGPVFHSNIGDIKLSVNSLPDLTAQTGIPFTFIPNDGAVFTIEATGIETVPATPWLLDKKTNTDQNLRVDPVYHFTASAGDDPSRFLLHFSGVGISESRIPNPVSVYMAGGIICISNNTGSALSGEIYIYNMIGQLMMQQELKSDRLVKINLNTGTGYYLVKVITGDLVYSGKVFIK